MKNSNLPHLGLSFLWIIFLFTRALGEGFPKPPLILFVIFIFIIIVKNIKYIDGIDKMLFIFLSYIFLSLIFISPPNIFQSYSRYFYFLMSLFASSSLIQGRSMREFRKTSLILILNFSVLIAIISFICFFLGINLVVRDFDDADMYLDNPNIFAGITSHSMILGFISMIAFVYTTYLSLNKNNYYIWIITSICFATCLFSASRAALIAGIIGFLYLIIICSKNKVNIIKRGVLICLIIFLSFPIWKTYAERVFIKQEMRVNTGMFDSRSDKVNARWKEFKNSPIIGIGFSVIDVKYDRIKASGAIEPGSSWLGVLSMTGIIGLLFFISIVFRSWNIVHKCKLSLYECLIVVMSIHMIVEGYVFSAGSIQCIILWTILGTSFDYCKTFNNYQKINN